MTKSAGLFLPFQLKVMIPTGVILLCHKPDAIGGTSYQHDFKANISIRCGEIISNRLYFIKFICVIV